MNAHNEQHDSASPVVKQNLTTQPAAAQEAVATVESFTNGSYHRNYKLRWHKNVDAGTQLFAAPVTAAPAVDVETLRALSDRWANDRSYNGSPVDDIRALIEQPTKTTPAAPGIDWPHIANEYADATCNGIQWLRNIRDGISTVDDALADMEANYARIQSLQIDAGNAKPQNPLFAGHVTGGQRHG